MNARKYASSIYANNGYTTELEAGCLQ